MNLSGLLVEYLVTGASTLVWIIFLSDLSGIGPRIDDVSPAEISALVPVAYILGIFIDYFGKILTDRFTIDDENETLHKSELFARSPEVGKQYEMRKSRDRIARGVLANVVLLGVIGGAIVARTRARYLFWWIPLFLLLTLVSFRIWQRCYKLTRSYKAKASAVLIKLRDEAKPKLAGWR